MAASIPPPSSFPSTQTSSDSSAILINVDGDDGDPTRDETLTRLPTRTTGGAEPVSSIHPTSEVQSGTLPHIPAHTGPTNNTSTSQSGYPDDSEADAPDDIEMDLVAGPKGHRRRRSSLMNTANGSAPQSRTGSRARGRNSIGDELTAGGTPRAWSKSARGDEEDEALLGEDLQLDEEAGLRRGDRTRKERKRRRNGQPDNMIAPENLTPDEKKLADKNVIRTLAINCGLVLMWYIFSLGISVYNKWMFGDGDDKLNFPFPLFTTALHMLVQFMLASLVLYFVPSMRPQNGRIKDSNGHLSDRGQSRHGPGRDGPIMSKMFYLTRIGPCGAATGLDIGLGNTSLKFITLTFYTMCKSSSLVFVLMFAFLFRLEKVTWRLVIIIGTMTIGVVMMVAGEIEFSLIGFVLIMTAAFFSGFRWGLTQILLLSNPATSNPFSSIFFLAPVMFLTLTALAIPLEGFSDLIGGLKHLTEQWGVLPTPFLILFPGIIAFLMTASEFALLQRTSVVTLSIAGIFKEVVTISTATVVFDDKLTAVNFAGLFVTIGAICAYNYIKFTKMRSEAQEEVKREHMELSETSMSDESDGDNDDDDSEDARLLQQSHTAERNGTAHTGRGPEALPARD